MADVGTINDYVSISLGRNQEASMSSLLLITQKLVERMQSERAETAVDFNQYDLVQANREKAKLVGFKDKVASAASLLSKTSKAIENISATLTKMRNELDLIGPGTSAEVRAEKAAKFDAYLATINGEANGANQTVNFRNVNLIGNTKSPSFATDNVATKYSARGGTLLVEGKYLGSGYHIEDADGDLWRYDGATNAFVEYGPDGYSPTGATISADGLTLESFDHDTGAVSYGGSGSLTGTVVRGGVGLLGSELYDGFADDASVAQVIADIDAAIAKVTSQGAAIKANAGLLQGNIDVVSEKLIHVEKEIDDLVDRQLEENGAKSAAAQAKLGLAISNLNLTANANTGLIENMLALASRPPSAPGVFGLIGY
jgi:hypothetical protein